MTPTPNDTPNHSGAHADWLTKESVRRNTVDIAERVGKECVMLATELGKPPSTLSKYADERMVTAHSAEIMLLTHLHRRVDELHEKIDELALAVKELKTP